MTHSHAAFRWTDVTDFVFKVDSLSAMHEARLAPRPAWTRDEISFHRPAAMLSGIVGPDLRVTALQGTRKLGQHNRPAESAGAIAGMAASAALAMSAAMAEGS